MPDKKLTDKEIVKDLEESISFDEPYESNFTLIRIEYIKNALDLINRLQAENESLWLCVYELKREVGRHERNYDPDEDTEKIIKTILAENRIPNTTDKINLKVYKEFVGKFKKELVGEGDG